LFALEQLKSSPNLALFKSIKFAEGFSIVIPFDPGAMAQKGRIRNLNLIDRGNPTYNATPGPYWSFNGRKLRDIYNATYQRPE
jgi:hypothetical protein